MGRFSVSEPLHRRSYPAVTAAYRPFRRIKVTSSLLVKTEYHSWRDTGKESSVLMESRSGAVGNQTPDPARRGTVCRYTYTCV